MTGFPRINLILNVFQMKLLMKKELWTEHFLNLQVPAGSLNGTMFVGADPLLLKCDLALAA